VLYLPAPLETLARIEPAELDAWRTRWSALPRPWIGVLVGGDRKPYGFDPATARRLGEAVSALTRAGGGSLLVTTGPRTRSAAAEALFATLAAPSFQHHYTPGQADNPYPALLALADRFIVTGDSASMLGEATATGKPIAVFPLPELHSRGQRLLRWLERRLGLVERAAGSRGTARQQNALGRAYDCLLAAGIINRARDQSALQQALGLVSLPTEPAPSLLDPGLLICAQAAAVERVRDLFTVERPLP